MRKKNDIVASVLSSVPLNVSFRRSLQDNDLQNWNELVMSIMNIQLNDNNDTFKWNLKANRIFTVHSMYLAEKKQYQSKHLPKTGFVDHCLVERIRIS